MILVRLLNLRFLNERAARNDRNLKFAALGTICSIGQQTQLDSRLNAAFATFWLSCMNLRPSSAINSSHFAIHSW